MLLRRHATDELLDLDGAPILGEGGQARIYAVSETLVAKMYHRPREPLGRKLEAMLASPPTDPMLAAGHVSIAWPVDLLSPARGPRAVAGFVMPRVSGMLRVFEFYNPRSRRQHCPFFDYAYLHRAARNLAAAVTAVHSRGYVIGDLNESNVLLRDTALVTLVDTDSFQVRDAVTGELYRCPVGKPEYTPPELQGKSFAEVERTPAHDSFALGVLIFQLLMEGTHPYMGEYQGIGDAPPLERRIGAGHFPFAPGAGWPFRPPPHALPIETLAPAVQQLFARCFGEGHRDAAARPDPREWQGALKDAEGSLATCASNEQHRYGTHLDTCPWCARAARLGGRDPFPSRLAALAGANGPSSTAPALLPAQAPLPAAGSASGATLVRLGTPGGVPGLPPVTAVPAFAAAGARHAAARAAARARGAALTGPAGGARLSPVRRTHASWIGAALVLALLTVASASMFWMAVGGLLAATSAVVGWRRVQAITPGLRPSVGFVLALIAVLLGVKTLVTVNGLAARTRAVRVLPQPTPIISLEEEVPPPEIGLAPPMREASAGADQSCALDPRAELYCWGRNSFTRSAAEETGENTIVESPVRVPMLAGIRFRSVSATGGGHACAVAVGDRVYCWGRNDAGQVGVPAAETGSEMVRSAAGLRHARTGPATDPVPVNAWGTSVSTGGAHTCVLDGSSVRCFGWNRFGQLGTGTMDDGGPESAPVSGRLAFIAVSAGGRHTCGITADGEAYCWGFNGSGQLGVPYADSTSVPCGSDLDGTTAYCEPRPVPVSGGLRFRSISAGADHTCGVTIDDRLYCWGLGDAGQRGTGSRLPRQCEIRSDDPSRCVGEPIVVGHDARFVSVSAGASHTCAVDRYGNAYCWGSNAYGQLGVEDGGDTCDAPRLGSDCSVTPVQIPDLTVGSISAGLRHTCAVTTEGRTVCWGGNEHGQTGTGLKSTVVELRRLLERSRRPVVRDAYDERGQDWGPSADVRGAQATFAPLYFQFQVDRPATPRAGNREPVYPARLRRRGVGGEVLVQFVVDTIGRAELPSVTVLRSTHPAFTSAVLAALPHAHFFPAEKNGRRVRQIMQLPFSFTAAR